MKRNIPVELIRSLENWLRIALRVWNGILCIFGSSKHEVFTAQYFIIYSFVCLFAIIRDKCKYNVNEYYVLATTLAVSQYFLTMLAYVLHYRIVRLLYNYSTFDVVILIGLPVCFLSFVLTF